MVTPDARVVNASTPTRVTTPINSLLPISAILITADQLTCSLFLGPQLFGGCAPYYSPQLCVTPLRYPDLGPYHNFATLSGGLEPLFRGENSEDFAGGAEGLQMRATGAFRLFRSVMGDSIAASLGRRVYP